MNQLKRTLALVLVLCMMCSFLPAGVLAAANDAPVVTGTSDAPFKQGTGGSNSFRIPAIVTLSDGTLVAAADARWNTTYDGGGLDTMVAISKDGGASWTHSFANYLGDNGNQYNALSTCFIDPSLAVYTTDENNDGAGEDTIYMLCDLYPAGIALNGSGNISPTNATGFNASGYLALKDSMGYTGYYLKDGKVYNSSNQEQSGYTVDEHFNIFQDNTYVSNLFFAGAPFMVEDTGFLYLTKSTDGGETWEAPQLLNLKRSGEMVCLVGPNGGMVTSNGVIVFPVYSYDGSTQHTSLIYSNDAGATWNRSSSLTAMYSSEADAVELDNGNLRVFFRNKEATLHYADFNLTTNAWSQPVDTTIKTNSDTELSAITYSMSVVHNGKEKSVILVSCPASANLNGSSSNDGSWRTSGRIFAGLVDPESYEMTWLDQSVAVTPVADSQLSEPNFTAEQGFFAYSSMTEQLDNGSVTILYENNQYGWGSGNNYYYTIASKTYTQSDLEKALGITFSGNVDIEGETPLESYEEDVTVELGKTFTETVDGIYVPSGTTENDYVSVSWVGTEDSTSTTVTITGKKVDQTTVELGNGAISYNVTVNSTASNIVDVQMKVNETKNFTIQGSNFEDSIVQEPAEAIADMTVTGTSAVRELREITSLDQFVSGKSYFITSRNGQHVLTDEAFDTNNNSLKIGGVVTVDSTELWTFTATDKAEYFTIARNGKYLNIAAGRITMGTDSQNLRVYRATYNGETHWIIADGNGHALNNSGQNNQKAGEYSPDAGGLWRIYEIVETPASTAVSFTGKAVGRTTAVIGDTTYSITVLPENVANTVNIEVQVGKTYTHTDTTGNHAENISLQPNNSIATMTVTHKQISSGDATYDVVNELVSGEKYLITKNNAMVTGNTSTGHNGSWSSAKGLLMTTDTAGQEQHLWTITKVENGYTIMNANGKYMNIADNGNNNVTLSDTPVVLTIVDNGDTFTIHNNNYCLNNFGGENRFASSYSGTTDANAAWTLKKYNANVTDVTEITFKGVAPGTTTAVVGNTLYNITVTSSGMTTVDIELEIGESFTYTDTTGNFSNNVVQEPDSKVTMAVAGTSNSYEAKLVPVTELIFSPDKRYVIESTQAKTIQEDHSVLTSTEATYTLTGLVMDGPLNANSSQGWVITSHYDNRYYITRNNEYLTMANQHASMETSGDALLLTYVDGMGWTIATDGGVYLCDLFGIDSGEAFGTTDTNNGGIYWNIYELVHEDVIDSTVVTFTGNAAGTTSAIVGNTKYNITVVPVETDDEVMNSATGIWTVDPEIQRQRYYSIVDGRYKDLYTDDSWKQYEAARQAAYKKLTEVIYGQYDSEDAANAALSELADLITELETAAGKLVSAKIISVKYHVDQVTEFPLDIKEYKVTSNDTTVTLPSTIVVNGIIYEVSNTTLTLQGEEHYYDVIVSAVGKMGGGFVGSENIDKGNYNGYHQLAKLVDDEGVGRKITELTFTTGFSYDLNLATDTTGKTVVWSSADDSVATVDDEGNVTAVAPGTTYITATVMDGDEVVEVNTIPITVYQSGTYDRTVALYAEQVDNTTVWCVVSGDTDAYAFEVIEGELIYGYFEKAQSDGSKTTAFSFFGDPDEAHALVLMKTTQAAGDYYLLHDDDGNLYDGTQPNMASGKYYVSGQTTGAGYWQAVGLNNNVTGADTPGWQIVKDMVQWAIDRGCDGGLGFTRRNTEGHLCDNLYFVSDPMARIEKVVEGVLPVTRLKADYKPYTENMVAAVKEQVYFKITITLEMPSTWFDADQTVSAIKYGDEETNYTTGAVMADTILPDAFLYDKEIDNLDGIWDGNVAKEYRRQTADITVKLNAPWTAEEKAAGKRVLEYYLVYEIKESDIPNFSIDNIANLTYKYKSAYSKGAQTSAADALASISVVGSSIDDVVIDFGQPFTYESHTFTSITDVHEYTFDGLHNVHLKGAYVDNTDAAGNVISKSKATAKYGDVTVTSQPMLNENGETIYDESGNPEYEYTITYIPHSILQTVDAVEIYGAGDDGKEKLINGFLVYPATTVYYEEGFLQNIQGWNFNSSAKATVPQTFELLGMSQFDDDGALVAKISNKKHAYGFDPIYDGIDNDQNPEVTSSSISIEETTIGNAAQFVFTGTGFEIFADCTTSTGYVSVEILNEEGNTVRAMIVNTVVKGGSTGATNQQDGNMNSLPVVSVRDLDHGTYTVRLSKVMAGNAPVFIDGVRIFNTVADSAPFVVDLEDNPDFYQLRDAVMNAIGITPDTSEDYVDPDTLKNMSEQEIAELLSQIVAIADFDKYANQVFNSMFQSGEGNAPAAVITDPSTTYGNTNVIQDLLDKGPKNELYLWPNQTLSFSVRTNRVMQVGLKAPRGSTIFSTSIQEVGSDMPGVGSYDIIQAETDMFYYLKNQPSATTDITYLVSITNVGEDVLAVTDLKICDDPRAALVPLTQEDINQILINAGYPDVNSEPETPAEPLPFVDVPEGSFYYDSVAWAVDHGITTGTSEDHFAPLTNCNRAQAVTFLWRALGCPAPAITKNPFVDVKAGSFYEQAVLWAVGAGVTEGMDSTHFAPTTECSRAQVVTFLYRAFNRPDVGDVENPFSDVPANAWYTAPILWAYEQGITTGSGNGVFGVSDVCNRAQIVTFLYRAFN